jgi:hypothetical protein
MPLDHDQQAPITLSDRERRRALGSQVSSPRCAGRILQPVAQLVAGHAEEHRGARLVVAGGAHGARHHLALIS